MKRSWAALACAALLAAGGALYAESSTSFTLEPSEMKEGETKTFTDDGKTITVRRDGNTTTVRIDQSDKTERLTITREGGRLRIAHGDSSGLRSFVVGPERRQITVDGFDLEKIPRFRSIPREASTYFVCPKDKTTLRVPEAKEEQSFKCPLDGSTMEKRKGRGFTLFFDDHTFESNVL